MGVGVIGGIATCTGVLIVEDPFEQNMAGLAPFFLPIFTIPIVALIAQIKYAVGIADLGESPGHEQVGAWVVSEDGEEIGRRRAILRQFVGSPMLSITVLIVIFAVILALVGELLDQAFGSSDQTDAMLGFLVDSLVEKGWFVPPILAIANHVLMAIDRKGRGLHDMIFGTVVVKVQ